MTHDWLNLIEVSGPFLAVPVLNEAFPQGLDALDGHRSKRVRRAYDEWRDAVDLDAPDVDEVHRAWIDEVLLMALDMDAETVRRGDDAPETARVPLPERGVTLAPDLVVVDPSKGDAPLLLVDVLEPDADPEAPGDIGGYTATPAERMVTTLRGAGCPVGLVTNGERWMLIHAPVGAAASFASWYARLWGQEPETLRAFVSLLDVRRFYGPEDERLPALHERSLKHQDEVTEALGAQVRRAVEVLVQSVDRADQDRERELLRGTEPRELYEAALTVMMRLVFLLAAEERGLLLLNDPRYDANYALSTLRMQLRAEPDEVLERRRSAWSRLLALFRAVYGGVDHPAMAMPALGGSLFDPDRYPFLEGRARGTSWRTTPAEPLPIDDRTVLLLLDAIQVFEGRTLSYRALDVEQIGHVYEGLLERTVERVDDVTLELAASAKASDPRVGLGELESAALDGRSRVAALLEERTERSASAIGNDLDREPDESLNARLITVCRGDLAVRDRVLPYAHLLKTDPWGYPLVHHAGAFVVVLGTDRRESGTHYTPKSLTEKIVEETLTPLVYDGPAEGEPREAWRPKGSEALLDLKVCDPAMGSGAFLVQVCRFLSERLVEAWAREEDEGHVVGIDGRVTDGAPADPMPTDAEERAVLARRLVAERCLYGVDLNPLAVELAKLSLWLTTLSKGRPFGFLDHNLKSGDSLLGIRSLDQLTELRLEPTGDRQLRLFGQTVERAVREALDLRQRLREIPIRDIRDVEAMAALDAEARATLDLPEWIADVFVGAVFAGDSPKEVEKRLASLAVEADHVVQGDAERRDSLDATARRELALDAPDGRSRRPFHWPLEYPEVFQRKEWGFDAFVGNPPFLGGKKIPTKLGPQYSQALKLFLTDSKGAADLVAYFFRRAYLLLSNEGALGLLSTKSIAETATRTVGLDPILNDGGTVYSAEVGIPWPGSASVVVSVVHIYKGVWSGKCSLDGRAVRDINSSLSSRIDFASMKRLSHGVAYTQGVCLFGNAFIRTKDEAKKLRESNPGLNRYLRRYVNGNVLNGTPAMDDGLYVIDFGDRAEDQIEGCEEIIEVLKASVGEERSNQTRQIHEHRPWLHWDKRTEFLDSARRLPQLIACVRVQRHLVFEFVDPEHLYADGLKLFADSRESLFACLQSTIHEAWARGASSKLGNSIRYSTSSSFDTFPFSPAALDSAHLSELGCAYASLRRRTAVELDVGLTDLYNRFHDDTDTTHQVTRLREAHVALDRAVASAYGWEDLDLNHGFHEVANLPKNNRLRFTISEEARHDVLRRLAELNRRRYEEEVEQGLYKKKSRPKASRAIEGAKLRKKTAQTGLDFGTSPATGSQGQTPEAVLGYLRAHPGWHAKSDVLASVGFLAAQWSATISDLVSQGHVERKGEKRGTRYRAVADSSPSRANTP